MRNSDNHETQSTPSVSSENKKDPWRKYRILAGLLTCYVGIKAAGALIIAAQISGIFGSLSGIMGGSGSGLDVLGGGVRLLLLIIAISSIIGGILFCRKKRSGSLMVWIAAICIIPIDFLVIYLMQFVPMYKSDIDWMPILFSLLISIFIIWVLKKTSPKKQQTQPKLMRDIIVVACTIVCVVVGFKAPDYFKEPDLFNAFQSPENVISVLEAGADPNQRTPAGTTALMFALQIYDNPKYAIALLEYGADPNETSRFEPNMYQGEKEFEHTPFVFAIKQKMVEVAELMIEKGADVNPEKANEFELSPLHRAVIGGHLDLVSAMLNKGAFVNHPQETYSSNKNPPLLEAIIGYDRGYHKNIDMVKLLLKHGADPNQIIKRNDGLEYTVIQRVEAVIKAREQKGGNDDRIKAVMRLLKRETSD